MIILLLPELEHPASFKVHFGILKDAINDIDIFSDKIALQVDEDSFRASADGEFGDASVKYLHGENINTHGKIFILTRQLGKCLKQTNSLKKLKSV